MYGGMSHKLSMLRKKTGGADVTPDAIDWPSVTGAYPPTTISQTFTGINTTITIQFNILAGQTLDGYYDKNSSGYTLYGNGDQITIDNGDTLRFRGQGFIISGGESIVTEVVNVSDGNALIDNFVLEVESFAP